MSADRHGEGIEAVPERCDFCDADAVMAAEVMRERPYPAKPAATGIILRGCKEHVDTARRAAKGQVPAFENGNVADELRLGRA